MSSLGTAPHDPDIEADLLGSALLNPEAVPVVAGMVADFYVPTHTRIASVIATLHSEGVPVDTGLVASRLKDTDKPLVLELSFNCPSSENFEYYARIVTEQATLRRYQVEGLELSTAAQTGDLGKIESVIDRMTAARSDVTADDTGSYWEPVDLKPILAGEYVADLPTMLERSDGVPLFYPGRTHLIIGETESAKTWFSLLAAHQELVKGNHVVFIDCEDTVVTAVERLRALGVTDEQMLERFSYYDAPALGRLDRLAESRIGERFETHGIPSLVIIDSLTEAMGPCGLNPDKGVDVTLFYSQVPRWFARMGSGVVMVDHVTKSHEGRGRWAIGSERKISGLTGAAYALDVVKPFGREKTGLAKVEVSKDRLGHVRQHTSGRQIGMFEMTSWPDGKNTTYFTPPEAGADPNEPTRPTVLMERASITLEEAAGPVSVNFVKKQTKGGDSFISVALELLVLEGYAETVKVGQKQLHQSVKPFRQ